MVLRSISCLLLGWQKIIFPPQKIGPWPLAINEIANYKALLAPFKIGITVSLLTGLQGEQNEACMEITKLSATVMVPYHRDAVESQCPLILIFYVSLHLWWPFHGPIGSQM